MILQKRTSRSRSRRHLSSDQPASDLAWEHYPGRVSAACGQVSPLLRWAQSRCCYEQLPYTTAYNWTGFMAPIKFYLIFCHIFSSRWVFQPKFGAFDLLINSDVVNNCWSFPSVCWNSANASCCLLRVQRGLLGACWRSMGTKKDGTVGGRKWAKGWEKVGSSLPNHHRWSVYMP